MSESLEKEVREWCVKNGFHTRHESGAHECDPGAGWGYIAGHQSAERKSAARIAELEDKLSRFLGREQNGASSTKLMGEME